MPWIAPGQPQRWPKQTDPKRCPVVDIKRYRLTGLRMFVFCTKPRGHGGGCSLG